ncbi:hypothetical protein TCON_0358 [Astathelohania contejeani]|uniref:Uncharacterized protein n=1 Tax=Astathelohania contejeani TaxID=164912 RepID=A0ABQ7I237_9MICR|nr:hypothetical protein TCON_0358 [Thelohania contejeani]
MDRRKRMPIIILIYFIVQALATDSHDQHRYLRGEGSHSGDVGKNQVVFLKDARHHGDGRTYVGRDSGPNILPNVMSLEEIHNDLNKAVREMHDANIAKNLAKQRALELRAAIEEEQARKKAEEAAALKALDEQASQEQAKPIEASGKEAIPVATFTDESNIMKHHNQMLKARIKGIQATENMLINSQKTVSKLDDITDQLNSTSLLEDDPELYKKFIDSGGVDKYRFKIPVLGKRGTFYFPNDGGGEGHSMEEEGNPNKNYSTGNGDQHSHFTDHGEYGDQDEKYYPNSPVNYPSQPIDYPILNDDYRQPNNSNNGGAPLGTSFQIRN